MGNLLWFIPILGDKVSATFEDMQNTQTIYRRVIQKDRSPNSFYPTFLYELSFVTSKTTLKGPETSEQEAPRKPIANGEVWRYGTSVTKPGHQRPKWIG